MKRTLLAFAFLAFLYAPMMFAGNNRFPLYVHSAASGDFSLIAQEALDYGKGESHWSIGQYLSITCAEDIPGIDPREIPNAVAGTFLNDDRIQQQLRAC